MDRKGRVYRSAARGGSSSRGGRRMLDHAIRASHYAEHRQREERTDVARARAGLSEDLVVCRWSVAVRRSARRLERLTTNDERRPLKQHPTATRSTPSVTFGPRPPDFCTLHALARMRQDRLLPGHPAPSGPDGSCSISTAAKIAVMKWLRPGSGLCRACWACSPWWAPESWRTTTLPRRLLASNSR